MAKIIEKIYIKNFRSIGSETIESSDVTSIVGKNDAGKSNILRALNLFFNDETDHKTPFDFESDFNKHAIVGKNKAKEIVIELTINLPDSYKRSAYPESVVWRKVWRRYGMHRDGEKRRFSDNQDFPPYSKIPSLLDRITYNYVPAIKDRSYFSDLQGVVYDVLASVAEASLHDSADNFEQRIQKHVKDLTSSISDVFGSSSALRLPRNLRQVFENLEFNSEGMPLSRRGDGIKVRHIPMILRFVAEQKNSIRKVGLSPHIWGFEEPENNVEMTASFSLAEQFKAAARDGFQVVITTHSPVFYGMEGDPEDDIDVYTLRAEKAGYRTQISDIKDRWSVDEEMGLMPLVTPYVMKERERLEERESEIKRLKENNSSNTPTIFVEGKTDRLIIERVLQEMGLSDKLHVDAGNDNEYGSANAAASRGIAWQRIQQHRQDPIKAAVLLDDDMAGDEAIKEINNSIPNSVTKHVYTIKLKPNDSVIKLKKKGYNLPVVLESLYPDVFWLDAQKRGWLINDGSYTDAIPRTILDDLVCSNSQLDELLEEVEFIRVTKKLMDKHKEDAANLLLGDSAMLDEVVGNLSVVLTSVAQKIGISN